MPTPIAPTPIVAYSGSLPDPSDPTTYGTRGRALWAWEIGAFYSGINAIGSNAYYNAQQATAAAVNAADSAEAAQFIVDAALWVGATNYTTGTAVVSPVDLQTYRRKSPGGTDGTDPSASALWTVVGDKFAVKASPQFTGRISLYNDQFENTRIGASQYMTSMPSDGNSFVRTSPIFENPLTGASTYVGAISSGVGAGAGFYGVSNGSNQWGAFTVESTGVSLRSGMGSAAAAGPIRFIFKGVELATLVKDGVFYCHGIAGTQGIAGTSSSAVTNFFWTGAALQLWVNDTNVGNVTVTSDYRIKKDVATMDEPALARISKLRPITYTYRDYEQLNFKADGVAREGFIAHELAEVVPSAVEGEKDAPNQVQSLRLDPLVALLTKAIQELQAEVAELRQQVNGLAA